MSLTSSTITAGWLNEAKRIISPFCDARPNRTEIDLIVIHAISLPPEEFGGHYISDLFTGKLDYSAHPYFQGLKSLEVSSHLLIRRDGEIIQYVPFHCRAWHAGQSSFKGRHACNDFSIGIELEGSDHQEFTSEQYKKLNKCLFTLLNHYPTIPNDHIVGHSDIAPGRKTDPGPHFDWTNLKV